MRQLASSSSRLHPTRGRETFRHAPALGWLAIMEGTQLPLPNLAEHDDQHIRSAEVLQAAVHHPALASLSYVVLDIHDVRTVRNIVGMQLAAQDRLGHLGRGAH